MVTLLKDYEQQTYFLNAADIGDIVLRNGVLVFLMDRDRLLIYDEDANNWYPVPTGGGGGDAYAIARSLLDDTATEYVDDTITILRDGAFYCCKNLTTIQCHAVTKIGTSTNGYAFAKSDVTRLAFPHLATGYRSFEGATQLSAVDLGASYAGISVAEFFQCAKLNTLVLRKADGVVSLAATNSFNGTPFASGGAGGTVYIPKALYDHLGDGTSLDYKAATNWSTVNGYGTITWAKIEGSIYETQYADGTPIS